MDLRTPYLIICSKYKNIINSKKFTFFDFILLICFSFIAYNIYNLNPEEYVYFWGKLNLLSILFVSFYVQRIDSLISLFRSNINSKQAVKKKFIPSFIGIILFIVYFFSFRGKNLFVTYIISIVFIIPVFLWSIRNIQDIIRYKKSS